MRKLLVLGVVAMAAPATADIYTDATGDLNNGFPVGDDFSGFTHLDIAQVEVTNTATDISFAVTLVGDILATDWGKYMVIIDSVAGGDPSGNGWGRPISMPSGADYWLGSWVDSGNGAEVYDYDISAAGAWTLTEATYNGPPDNDVGIATTQFTATITTPLSALGLTLGDAFDFDVFSSGGGGTDSAIDALGNPNPSVLFWGDPYTVVGASTYVTPEPASCLLLAVGGMLAVARRRR